MSGSHAARSTSTSTSSGATHSTRQVEHLRPGHDLIARLRFGYMPEERGLYPRMQVADELVYFARLHGVGRAAAEARADAVLERLGLAGRARASVEQLSHGNQQRVQLAAALVHEPCLLVLDEPFAGLDPLGVEDMTAVLRGRSPTIGGPVTSASWKTYEPARRLTSRAIPTP